MQKKPRLNRGMRVMLESVGIEPKDSWQLPTEYSKAAKALSERVFTKLTLAFPELPSNFCSEIAVDLSDFWEVGRYHEYFLEKLLKLRLPKERAKLLPLFSVWIEVQLLTHGEWHLKSLKKAISKMINAAEGNLVPSPRQNHRSRKK